VTDAEPVYTEKHCALPWTLMLTGLLSLAAGVVAALVTIVLSLTVSPAILILTAVAVLWALFWVRYLRSTWPTGIWVDQAGIRIGDAPALPFATSQSQTVFTCSWAAVRGIAVTERPGRRLLGRSPRAPGPPGTGHPGRASATRLRWLLAPFTRAALVIYADHNAAGAPRTELVDNVYSHGTPPRMWIAPTRRPQALRAALAQVPGCPPVADHTDPDVP
jgi:hypothetical protein